MNTEHDIRRMAFQEAAVTICAYCQGVDGFDPVPVPCGLGPGLWHMLTHGNGADKCHSTALWEMAAAEQVKREAMRSPDGRGE